MFTNVVWSADETPTLAKTVHDQEETITHGFPSLLVLRAFPVLQSYHRPLSYSPSLARSAATPEASHETSSVSSVSQRQFWCRQAPVQSICSPRSRRACEAELPVRARAQGGHGPDSRCAAVESGRWRRCGLNSGENR